MSADLPQPGDRVRITGVMPEDPDPLPVGTEGTVRYVNGFSGSSLPHQIMVTWDVPRSLILLATDPYEILPADPVPGATAVCRHCQQPITYGTETEPGFLPRTGWRDSLPHPLSCLRALNFQHVPR